ncbi:MAG: M48 family metallopeptidase [Thaumarchaeota archaeon]|nr:M48 family metallopeptidase [Nitrososphaerota archaeon]
MITVAAIKIGFMKRQVLYSSVLLFSAAYALSPPALVLRLVLLVAIWLSAELTFILFVRGLVKTPLELYFSRKSLKPTEVAEIREVAQKVGVHLPEKAFWLTERDITVATNIYSKKMLLNKNLVGKLTGDELRFVGGHEITHIIERTRSFVLLVAYGVGATLVAAVPLAILGLPSTLISLPASATMIIAICSALRKMELRADRGGAKFVSFDVAESAMIKVYDEYGIDFASDTHPSGNTRIRNLKKFYNQLATETQKELGAGGELG